MPERTSASSVVGRRYAPDSKRMVSRSLVVRARSVLATAKLTCRAAVQSSLLPRNTYTSARNFEFGAAQPGQVQRLVVRRFTSEMYY